MTQEWPTGMPQGMMPQGGDTYESFERLLARFFLSLRPLRFEEEDEDDIKEALNILDGFAARHQVRPPEEAAREPHLEGTVAFDSCTQLFDALESFWRTFGIGIDPMSEDNAEWRRLKQIITRILCRHRIVEFITVWDQEKSRLPLKDIVS